MITGELFEGCHWRQVKPLAIFIVGPHAPFLGFLKCCKICSPKKIRCILEHDPACTLRRGGADDFFDT